MLEDTKQNLSHVEQALLSWKQPFLQLLVTKECTEPVVICSCHFYQHIVLCQAFSHQWLRR